MFVQLAFFSCCFSAAHIVWEAAAADKGEEQEENVEKKGLQCVENERQIT